jgi:hypothetical protein
LKNHHLLPKTKAQTETMFELFFKNNKTLQLQLLIIINIPFHLLQFGKLLETPAAEVNGAGRLFRMPSLLRFDLNREGVAECVLQVLGGLSEEIK